MRRGPLHAPPPPFPFPCLLQIHFGASGQVADCFLSGGSCSVSLHCLDHLISCWSCRDGGRSEGEPNQTNFNINLWLTSSRKPESFSVVQLWFAEKPHQHLGSDCRVVLAVVLWGFTRKSPVKRHVYSKTKASYLRLLLSKKASHAEKMSPIRFKVKKIAYRNTEDAALTAYYCI